MPRSVDPAMQARYVAAYRTHGSFEKAARALSQPRHRIVQAVYRAEGRCQCGRPSPADSAGCALCLERSRRNTTRRHAQRAEAQTCRECSSPLAPGSRRFCASHLTTLRAKQQIWRDRQRATGACIYCLATATDTLFCDAHRAYDRRKSIATRSRHQFGGLLEAVLERDGHQCRICTSTTPRLEVHHIDGRANTLDNLITLCTYCHKTVTFLNYCPQPEAAYAWAMAHRPATPESARSHS